jgi:hypothetical protein
MNTRWARWWIYPWALVAMALVGLVFVLSFRWWVVAATAGFGTMETLGLVRRDDAYPPLTHVIRDYVPRWLAFPVIYGFTGAAGAEWLGFGRVIELGALFALLGWFTTHFDVAFDSGKEAQERAKNRRLLGVVMRSGQGDRRVLSDRSTQPSEEGNK